IVWTSNLDGELGRGPSLAISTLRPGTHVVTAAVTDSAGGAASAAVTVTVSALPSVAISVPLSGTTVHAGGVVTFTGAATDPEDGDLGAAIVWTSNLDGEFGTGRSLGISTLRPGTH